MHLKLRHRRTRVALTVVALLTLPLAAAQSAWFVVAPEEDVISFAGLGSMFVAAFAFPADMDASDTALVVACDPDSPVGVEVSVWIDTDGRAAALAYGNVLLRADQGAILEREWLRMNLDGFTEAIAPYEETGELLDLLDGAQVLAFRLSGVPGASTDRTFQFDVTGFASAFATLRCATLEATPASGAAAGGEPSVSGAWGVIPGDYVSAGASVNGLDEVLVVFCRSDANGIGIDVGAYGAATIAGTAEAVFRSGSVDFLTARLQPNAFGSYELVDDVDENRLVRNLRLMTDVTVTLRPVAGGASRSFTLPTDGFGAALDALGCFVATR